MSDKKDIYIWWAAPVTILMFTLWIILMLLGVPMPMAFALNATFDIGFWIIYSFK